MRPNVRASKLIALALSHDPAALGITLDRAGFASVASLARRPCGDGVTSS
jgi:RNA:NAD 2'-phosphotransferase (TPT1/KptA family)